MPRAKRITRSESKARRRRAAGLAAASAVNQAETYGVRVVEAQVEPGGDYWRAISVRHLTPEENQGRHNVYVDAQDESGKRLRDTVLRIGWTWEGRRPDENAEPKPLDKPENEPAGNLDLFRGQRIEAWIQGDGLPSDHVANMHTDHADEPGPSGELWNSRGHHSYHVLFRRTRKPEETDGNGQEPGPEPTEFRFEAWPSEFRVITQQFGANPDAYEPFGLPGHEGMDIRATAGSKVFCVAPGQVKLVNPGSPKHNYGIHVRVLHAGGYETIYAHLQSLAVEQGQTVEAGQVLGLADNTGNSRGDHLHLTLKHHGEAFDGYPSSIIDPTPYLMPLLAREAVAPGLVQVRVSEKLGLNCNAPTDDDGNITPRVADPGLIADTGVGWVRVNFILRPFDSPADPRWISTYRNIITGLRGRGLKIYGLVHAQAVTGDPGNQFREKPTDSIENDWIRRYAENFRVIVQEFRDVVDVFESFNEPNNWHHVDKEWKKAWVDPEWFAVMLQQVYEAVSDLSITLVSGPLLSTQHGNDAATYLAKVYAAGKARFRWGEPGSPVPFDGVGFHPYVRSDPQNPAEEIPAQYREYMNGVRNVMIDAEKGRLRPIYLSEIGWQNAEDRQVECMKVGLRTALDDPSIALCLWYGMQDDPGESYGLYRKDGLSPGHRKPIYQPFAELAREDRQVPIATIRPAPSVSNSQFVAEFDQVPDGTILAPGRAFTKVWRLKNTGATTWGDGYRLLRVEGQSLGALASISVPDCPPGQTADLSVAFIAPSDPAEYVSTWQLVDPQGNRFGQKVWTKIRVQAAAVQPAAPRGAPFALAPLELPAPTGPGFEQPAAAAALGIIYTTYWLRALAASAAPDPQQALLAAANDALAQIEEWLGRE